MKRRRSGKKEKKSKCDTEDKTDDEKDEEKVEGDKTGETDLQLERINVYYNEATGGK